jgi:mannose-6-phosphate isomerase-like protein (cupin superfamily)
MGGICTILGTPPNLIISGMYAEQTGEHMNIFVTTIPGLFCLTVGILSILAMRRLLPKRKAPEDVFANTEDYTMEFLVPSDSKYIGSTLAEAGMTKVPGGQLLEVISFDKEVVSPVPDDMLVVGGDRLVYCGQINELIDLRESRGLLSVVNKVFAFSNSKKKRQLHTAEAMDAIDFRGISSSAGGPALAATRYQPQRNQTVTLADCPYFTTHLIPFDTPIRKNLEEVDTFVVYFCVEGIAAVKSMDTIVPIHTGECVLVPAVADSVELFCEGPAKLLEVTIDTTEWDDEMPQDDWVAQFIGGIRDEQGHDHCDCSHDHCDCGHDHCH